LEWWLAIIVIFGGFVAFLLMGIPVAFAFTFINLIGIVLFYGSIDAGLRQLILSITGSISFFALLPIPLFVLMGEIMFRSGVAPRMMDVLDKWMGRLPGRLSLVAVAGGTVFASMCGAATAGTAMLGSVLVPEMEKAGYKKPMSLGPILGSGGLAIMIPPSALGVLLGALAKISVGAILVGIIIPGLLMAILYASYIIVRSRLQPSIAPRYELTPVSLTQKITLGLRYVLPLGSIIFLVVGVIFIGVATPTEAAALGAFGCFVLAFIYRGMNWPIAREIMGDTLRVAVMVLMIFTGSTAFSQILAYSGASRGLVELVVSFDLPPIILLIAMQAVLLVMGCFMESLSIMMVTIPIFMPIVSAVGMNPLWFGIIMLLNMEMAQTTPPFGLSLFVMKGVAPPGTTMGDIYRAGLPFIGCDMIAMILLIVFPPLALWLPSLMA